MNITEVPIDEIVIDDDLDFRSTGGDITELAENIAQFGLMQPVTVAPPNGDGKYHVIAGRRRLRALAHNKAETVPVIVRDDMTSTDAQIIGQIIENLHREDVSVLDEARSYAKLLELDVKQKDIAKLVNKSATHVSGRIAMLKLPEDVITKVEKGYVSREAALKLARAPKAVRDEVIKSNQPIDARAISAAERRHSEVADRKKRAAHLAKLSGLPGVTDNSPHTWLSPEEVAERAGLTDDDKPKSHDWVTFERLYEQNFETDELLAQAIVDAKAKVFYLAGSRVELISSENVDLQRKKRQEEMDRLLAEREAERAKGKEMEERARATVLGSIDKATLIAGVLNDFLRRQFAYGGVDLAAEALGRLDLPVPERVEDQAAHEWGEVCRTALYEYASKSSTNLMRAIVASQNSWANQVLIDQGILDHIDLTLVKPQVVRNLMADGALTVDDLPESMRQDFTPAPEVDVEDEDGEEE